MPDGIFGAGGCSFSHNLRIFDGPNGSGPSSTTSPQNCIEWLNGNPIKSIKCVK
ncbi:hypothetical protein LTR95_014846 [Oleoguttula sp. CCFEE 5521]